MFIRHLPDLYPFNKCHNGMYSTMLSNLTTGIQLRRIKLLHNANNPCANNNLRHAKLLLQEAAGTAPEIIMVIANANF
jgi:hypothetical protein